MFIFTSHQHQPAIVVGVVDEALHRQHLWFRLRVGGGHSAIALMFGEDPRVDLPGQYQPSIHKIPQEEYGVVLFNGGTPQVMGSQLFHGETMGNHQSAWGGHKGYGPIWDNKQHMASWVNIS